MNTQLGRWAMAVVGIVALACIIYFYPKSAGVPVRHGGDGVNSTPSTTTVAANTASATPPSPVAGNGPYKVQLTPKFKAGQAFDYHSTAQVTSTIRGISLTIEQTPAADAAAMNSTAGAKQLVQRVVDDKQDSFAVEFSAQALARTVYPNGTLREVLFQVRRCEMTKDGNVTTLVPEDAVLAARREDDGRVSFSSNGEWVPQEKANALALVVQMGNPQFNYDEALGPGKAMAIGSDWPVNKEALLHSGLSEDFPGANDATGNFHLLAVRADETEGPLSVVEGDFALLGVQAPFHPPTMTKPSVVNFQLRITSPLNPGAGRHDVELRSLIHHEGQNGSLKSDLAPTEMHIVINVALVQATRYTYNPALKPAVALISAPVMPPAPKMTAAPSNPDANFVRAPQIPLINKQNSTRKSPPTASPGNTTVPGLAPVDGTPTMLASPRTYSTNVVPLASPAAKPAAATTPSTPPALVPSTTSAPVVPSRVGNTTASPSASAPVATTPPPQPKPATPPPAPVPTFNGVSGVTPAQR
jgi:hypothetical protein